MKTKELKFDKLPLHTAPKKEEEQIKIDKRESLGNGRYLILYRRYTGCICNAKGDSLIMKSNKMPTRAQIFQAIYEA